MLNMPSWTALDAPRDLAKIMDTTEYAKWKGFRQSEDSRYVALALPRVLGRLPYGKDTKPVEEFNYEEHVDEATMEVPVDETRPSLSASRMTNSFSQYGMCVAMRGVEAAAWWTGLAGPNFYTDEGDVAMKCPTR